MKPSSHSLTLNTSSLIQYVMIAFTTKTTLVKILLALPRLQNVKATFITLTFSLRKKKQIVVHVTIHSSPCIHFNSNPCDALGTYIPDIKLSGTM